MNKPLKILHSEAAVSFGGQEHRILKEMLAMREAGHHVELACRPQAQLKPRMEALGFRVHAVPMEKRFDVIRGALEFRRILQAGRFDVLNTHSRKDTLPAALGARLAGTPLIVRTRHLASSIGSLLSYTWLPHRVSTVSRFVTQMLLDKGVPEYKVETIYTPVQPPDLSAAPTLRSELGLGQDAVIALCAAVMRAPKGHLFLLDALEALFARHPHFHLVLAGAGEPVFSQVQRWVETRGLSHQIHLLGYRKDVPSLMADSDFFILATQREALGTVFLEAQMMGLPVVAADAGGVRETFQNGRTGLLVPAQDRKALADAAEKLLTDPQLRESMGQQAKAWMGSQEAFTPAYMAAKTTQTYQRWLAELGHAP